MPIINTGAKPAATSQVVTGSTEVVALNRSFTLTLGGIAFGATAPTAEDAGTTPTMDVRLFDATAQTINVIVTMPPDWDKDFDCALDLVWALKDAETNTDTLDLTLDYITMRENTTGQGVTKTSTQVTDTVTATTGNGLAVGDIYTSSFALSQGDVNNGFSSGDESIAFGFEWHLTNITGVTRAQWLSGRLRYRGLY
jgi:hypothetical protein